jgi:glycerol-3-phosphate acyltransferase PlsY
MKASMLLCPAVVFGACYVAGSIHFSIVLFKALGKDDPRERFSGNAGATNVYRQAGLAWAALVLLLDMARARALAARASHDLAGSLVPWAGLPWSRVTVFRFFIVSGEARALPAILALPPIFLSRRFWSHARSGSACTP